MLSVPPLDTEPHTAASAARCAPSMFAVIETISASYFAMLGQRSEWSGLVCDVIEYTSLRKAMCSGSPW